MFASSVEPRPRDPFHLGDDSLMVPTLSPVNDPKMSLPGEASKLNHTSQYHTKSDDAMTVDSFSGGEHMNIYENIPADFPNTENSSSFQDAVSKVADNPDYHYSTYMDARTFHAESKRERLKEDFAVALDQVYLFASTVQSNVRPTMDKAVHLVYRALCSHVASDPTCPPHLAVPPSLADMDAMCDEERSRLRKDELMIFARELEQLTKDAIDVLSVACDITRQSMNSTFRSVVASVDKHLRPLMDEWVSRQKELAASSAEPTSPPFEMFCDDVQFPRCRIESFPFDRRPAVQSSQPGAAPAILSANHSNESPPVTVEPTVTEG